MNGVNGDTQVGVESIYRGQSNVFSKTLLFCSESIVLFCTVLCKCVCSLLVFAWPVAGPVARPGDPRSPVPPRCSAQG